MKHWIRRTFTLSALIATTAIGFTAMAQPLPLPPQPKGGGGEDPLRIDLVAPPKGAEATYGDELVWENSVQPDKYILKFKMANGQNKKFVVPMSNCVAAGNCSVTLEETGVLDTAKDGEMIKWRVLATLNGVKSKSAARTIMANTVSMPQLINAIGGDQLQLSEELLWSNSDANAKYTLIVREAETGALVIKRTLPAAACGEVCEYNPISGGVLKMFTVYTWFVKAKGFNGKKVKSGNEQFVTGGWPVALK